MQLGIFRSLAGVGTGAEIIVGIPFVAEGFAERNRARILGIMMTGGAVGTLVAAQVYHVIGQLGLALGVLCRHRSGAAARVHSPRHGRAGAFAAGVERAADAH